mgnify:CR=1 FL=1
MTEAAIIERAARGDRRAFRMIYDQHLRSVAVQVGRTLGHGHDIESVVQEVFIQVFKSLPSYQGRSSFRGWLAGVTRHVVLAHLRKHKPVVELGAFEDLRGHDLEWSRLTAREKIKILHATLDALSPEYREAFVHYEIEGRTLAEIAQMVDAPLNTVAARVRRARERVRRALEKADAAGMGRHHKEGSR